MNKSHTKSTEHSEKKDFTPHHKPISKKHKKKKEHREHKKRDHHHERGHKKTHDNARSHKVTKHLSTIPHKWVELPHPKGTVDQPPFLVRLLSFNILADCNVQHWLYPNVKSHHLDWKNRQPLITSQIIELDPDIACLQEFEPSVSEDLLGYMTRAGYQFEFKGKTGDKEEGCITFWKESKYELKYNFNIDMNFETKLEPLSFLDKDNIAQIVVLKSKTTDHVLIVGNTHLLFNMKRGEIKLGQIIILLKSLNEVMALCDREGLTSKNIFICGDFNSIPNSLLYNVFSQPTFTFFEVPSAQMSNQFYAKYLNESDDINHFVESTKKFTPPPGRTESKYPTLDSKFISALQRVKAKITENLKEFEYSIEKEAKTQWKHNPVFSRADFGIENTQFQSSYALVNKEHRHSNPQEKSTDVNRMFDRLIRQSPRYTTDRLTYENGLSHVSGEFKAVVDYIWFGISNKLKPYRVLETLSYEKLRDYSRGFPNADHPSDHLPLVTDFYGEADNNRDPAVPDSQ